MIALPIVFRLRLVHQKKIEFSATIRPQQRTSAPVIYVFNSMLVMVSVEWTFQTLCLFGLDRYSVVHEINPLTPAGLFLHWNSSCSTCTVRSSDISQIKVFEVDQRTNLIHETSQYSCIKHFETNSVQFLSVMTLHLRILSWALIFILRPNSCELYWMSDVSNGPNVLFSNGVG